MDYQKEYAILVGQVDRAISILECCDYDDLLARKAGQVLAAALREAEERYISQAEGISA